MSLYTVRFYSTKPGTLEVFGEVRRERKHKGHWVFYADYGVFHDANAAAQVAVAKKVRGMKAEVRAL